MEKLKDFNEFRLEFWKEISKSKYSKNLAKIIYSNISKGKVPISVEEQWFALNLSINYIIKKYLEWCRFV